ncbi:MAG: methionine adenosyltransferase domain-containing protein, partial [Rhodothermales bacterium]
PDVQLVRVVREVFDLRPSAIIERLDLLKPQFLPTAAYGHFGRSEFSWENLDHVDALKAAAKQFA